jgi:response regulator RpfG family c-di-GMP phosphodiesterase
LVEGKDSNPKVATSVLLVDDEQNVLDSLALLLRRRYKVTVASSGAQGLEVLSADPTIAVIVSDMRMPGMNGAAFLAEAHRKVPNAVRMLLTGQTDMASAIAAINEGQIFRFLTKPCAPSALIVAMEAACAQHQLLVAEKVLLEQTLRGSIQTLTQILAMANPSLFGRATRVKRIVSDLMQKMAMPDQWQVDVAAMLLPLAQISLPSETAEKVNRAAQLSAAEQAMVARLPEVTDNLLAHIPRLETVRAILASAQEPRWKCDFEVREADASMVSVGAELIKAAVAFDALTQNGLSAVNVIGAMRSTAGSFDDKVLTLLTELYAESADLVSIVEISVNGLAAGMVLAEDLITRKGLLVMAQGCELTDTFIERIRNYRPGAFNDTVRVVITRVVAQDDA